MSVINHSSLITSQIDKYLTKVIINSSKVFSHLFSVDTAFPKLPLNERGRFNSTGQCATASRLLKDIINEKFPNLELSNTFGNVENKLTGHIGTFHTWLEIKDPNDPYIIDITPKQKYAFGSDSPSLILGRQSELSVLGLRYSAIRYDTDEILKNKNIEPGAKTWERYKTLKERFQVIQRTKNLYKLINNLKIFIPVGDEKNRKEIIRYFSKNFFYDNIIDINDIYKVISFFLLQNLKETFQIKYISKLVNKPDFFKGLYQYIKKIRKNLSNLNYYSERDSMVYFSGNQKISKKMNSILVEKIAKKIVNMSLFRMLASELIISELAKKNNLLITGDYERDVDLIDTTIFEILVVSKNKLNEFNHIKQLDPIICDFKLNHLNDYQDIYNNFIKIIKKQSQRKLLTVLQKTSKIKKMEWQISDNPFIVSIKNHINKNRTLPMDLQIQIMLYLTSYDYKYVWSGKTNSLMKVAKSINDNKGHESNQFWDISFKPNEKIINKVITQCEAQLDSLYKEFPNNLKIYLEKLISDKPPVNLQGEIRIIRKGNISINHASGTRIYFKKTNKKINTIMGKFFHYLHSERVEKGTLGYGAFLKDWPIPFAWLCFSKIDREYKKNMYRFFNLESYRILEITRGWNASWAPKNMMSSLFSYATNQIKKDWVKKVNNGHYINKPLLGFSTVINPNLGFTAKWLRGSQFFPCGFRPALTYFYPDNNNNHVVVTRRRFLSQFKVDKLTDLHNHKSIVKSKMPLLPLIELILIFDKNKRTQFIDNPYLYYIPKKDYELH